jgi:hypothetical protein
MPKKMYKKGSEPITVHDSQIENAKARGWSLEKTTKVKEVKSNKKE